MSILSILVIMSTMQNINLKEKGLNFVAATIGQPCKYDLSYQDDTCANNPGWQTDPEHAEKGDCCPNIVDPDNPVESGQQYCHDDKEEDAYCNTGKCKCYTLRVMPLVGERYGVGTCVGDGCGGLGTLSCKGIYFNGLCLEGHFYSINANAIISPQKSVFVNEKFDWVLTEKGEPVPVTLRIAVW